MKQSAKEKAVELVEKFKPYSYYDSHDLTSRRRREESNIESAIECALIAVDEIIILGLLSNSSIKYNAIADVHKEYWQEVKKEIENYA
jgi:hypothetical protein